MTNRKPLGSALVALLVALVAVLAPPTAAAQKVSVTFNNATFPPAWVHNKTEWRSRLYNSLRLTPAQVRIFENVLDARDFVKAPVKNATWTAAEAVAAAARASLRNSTLFKSVAEPVLAFENKTSTAIVGAKERALNATEIKLETASLGISSAAAALANATRATPLVGQAAALAATRAAKLIASALNVTAELVGMHLADLVVVEQYREAARLSKLQALSLAQAEQQGAFATLGTFQPSVAPVTTPPAPLAPAGSAASAPALSPEDEAAAAAFLAEAASLPKSTVDPATSTTSVGEGSSSLPGGATSFAKASPVRAARAERLLAKQRAFEESLSSDGPASPHPAALVDDADEEIAQWLSEKPHNDGDDEKHLFDVARWVSAAPEMEEDEGSLESDDAVASYAARTQASFAAVASSDAAPVGGVVSPEVVAEARDSTPTKTARLPSSAFYRVRYDNGTTSRSTPPVANSGEQPAAALGAPTFPATSLDALALQASPSIKQYYSYLALRAIGFPKALAATATAATTGGLAASLKYALLAAKIELTNGADPVWVGQSATPFSVPQTGVTYSFAQQDQQQMAGKRRLLADEAASSSSSSPRRKLSNFGTNTSPPPPPSPPPPGPSPPPPSPPGPSPSPSPPGNPAFGTYTPFRADTTAASRQVNMRTIEPPDGGVCAGAGFVLSMANAVVSVRSQSDPATSLRTVSLFTFFQGSSGDGYGDPHCIYHAASGRFFAVAYQTTSTLATFVPLAMSSVNDPLGAWTVYRINTWNNANVGLSQCNAQTPCFGDYPQLGANEDSVWVTTNQFKQQNNQLSFAGVLITAFGVSNLVAGGTQTPFQTSSTSLASVKPMNVAGQASTGSTMYLATVQTSTSIYLLKYSSTSNLASNSAPVLASQRSVSSSVSVGGSQNYASSAVLASGTSFDGGDDRLIGLSYAGGRLLASATSFYGTTSAPPKLAVVYWFINAASATEVYAGVFGDASWNAWSTSTVLDPNNVDRGFIAGMIATTSGYSPVSFPTASLFGTVQVGVGSSNGAALVSSSDGQYLYGFSSPLRTGDYSTSALDPATGVAWLLSEQGQSYATTSSNNWGTVLWRASFT